ncbi:MAG: hypothetical protein CMM95_01645 [Rickettsiales bacterium]|nr:hypothetical protein [Rickettsiales bacterium]
MSLVNIKESNSKSDINQNICVGIDFGTTNSVCAVKIDEKTIFVEDKKKKKLIPSIILYDDGKKIIGNDVINEKNFLKSIFSIKRYFTKNPESKKFVNENNDKVSPIDIAKEIFSYLKKSSEQFLKKELNNCVLTVPAYFDERARAGIMKAAFMSGLNVKRLINEPTSAAFAYGLEKKRRGNYFVYDLGGGTFDVSLLRLSEGIFKVIGTSGDPNLGGDDFDELFAKKIIRDFFKLDFNELTYSEKVDISKKCKFLKEKLYEEDEFFEEIKIRDLKKKIKITKSFFNQSIEKLLNRTIEISSRLLNECELSIDKVDGFILVGGSTRINYVKEKILKEFSVKIFNDIDPDLVVSHGAALHGYELINGSENLLLDVTPLSLGIETMGGLMEKIISRNTTIPVVKEQIFTTNENGQTSIKITILQGERETSENNRILGEFILSGLEPKPSGIPRIKVVFSLDVDGILFVSANDETSGEENHLVIKTDDGLNINDMRKIVESSIENAKDDMQKRMLIESKIKANGLLNEIDAVKKDIDILCSKKDIEKINKFIKMLKEELKRFDADKINDLIEKLNESTKSFAQRRIDEKFSSLVGKKTDLLEK